MEGLSRALGAGPTVELCGRSYTVQGKVVRYYGLMEAEIIKQRGDPLQMMRQMLPEFKDDPDVCKVIIREAYEQAKRWKSVTGEELRDWMNTFRGRCFIVWLCIRNNDPDTLTLEKVTELFCDELERQARAGGEAARQAKIQEIDRAIDQASGEDELGNSTGPQASGARREMEESPIGA